MPITVLQLREDGPLLAFETINNQIDFKNIELLKQEGLEEGDLVIAKYLVDENMNVVTSLPSSAYFAIVPPHPKIWSSECAQNTNMLSFFS